MRRTRRWGALLGAALSVTLVAGCAQPTEGRPVADRAAADAATDEAIEQGIKAFQDHFTDDYGDEHATAYNYINFGDTRQTTEHESFLLGDPPMLLAKRRYHNDGDWSQTLTPPRSEVDYVELDEDHAHLAPTPWVSVPTLYDPEFGPCLLTVTAWLACHLDTAMNQTELAAPDRLPREARATEDGFEVVTGVLVSEMINEGFLTLSDEALAEVTDPMRDYVVPVTIKLDEDMEFTGFELRAKITDGDAPTLELQLGYEALGESDEDDFPDVPDAADVTVISDEAAADEFWDKFNTRDPEK